MKIEIDQSGKIENTNKDTVIAFSDDNFGSLLIKAKDKREIQEIFRQAGKPRVFIYKLFTILIFLLIKNHLKKVEEIVIDEEYPGKSALIKDLLLREIRKIRPRFLKENISFRQIGKKSKAHNIAYNTFKKKRKTDIVVNKKILKFLIK